MDSVGAEDIKLIHLTIKLLSKKQNVERTKIKTSVYNSQKTAPGPRFDIQAFAGAVVILSLWETALFFKIMLFERRRSEFMILKNVFSSLSQA